MYRAAERSMLEQHCSPGRTQYSSRQIHLKETAARYYPDRSSLSCPELIVVCGAGVKCEKEGEAEMNC